MVGEGRGPRQRGVGRFLTEAGEEEPNRFGGEKGEGSMAGGGGRGS